jgi:CNP1-like family protein
MRVNVRNLSAAFCAVLALETAAQPTQTVPGQRPNEKSDWEIEQERKRGVVEGEVKLPPYFKESDLIEFEATRASSMRFYVDRASVSVGTDLVVRYTLVARSPQGAENVTYEGIHCKGGTSKVYALGQAGGIWKAVDQPWQPTDKLWQRVLRRDYFCPMHRAIYSVAEGIDALRRGGHPDRDNVH